MKMAMLQLATEQIEASKRRQDVWQGLAAESKGGL